MASDFDFSTTDYACNRIAQSVRITVKNVYLRGGLTAAPSAMAMVPKACTGMPVCQLFPSGDFPPVSPLTPATGCPFIDTLKSTGR